MNVKRVSFIDGLRGFSLLGILLANLLIFQYGIFGKDELNSLSSLDQAAYKFTKIVIEGSSMPIFTMLFGYSLMKLVASLRTKRGKSRWSLIRRSTGLILLGWLHSTFLWEGDILFSYGIMLLLLIPFINRKAKTVFIWSGVLFVLAIALMYGQVDETAKEKQATFDYIAQANEVYANGSYTEVYEFRNHVPLPNMEDPLFIFFIVLLAPIMYAPMFLLGMGFAKIRAFEEMDKERKWYIGGALLVPIGLVCKVAGMFETEWMGILEQGGAQILSVGYICLFALVYRTKLVLRVSFTFENVGKLSLTNYIMQTICCTFFFYGYGLGFYGELGVGVGIVFGLLLYILQCVASTLYLKRFKRGPLEVLLRIWTNLSWNGKTKVKEVGLHA